MYEENFEDFHSVEDPDFCANALINTVQKAIARSSYECAIPAKKLRLQEWMTDSILKSIRRRNKMYKKVKALPKDDTRFKKIY